MATYKVTARSGLRVRSKPNGTILTAMPYGTTVSGDGKKQGGWYHVKYKGRWGWSYGQYLKTVAEKKKTVASIAAKRDEPGLLEAAAQLGAALAFFSPEQLAAVPAPHPSDTVKRHMGVGSVCEAAAMLASGGGKLLAPKTVTKCSTAALCLAV